jgi:hypothetical protein
LQHTVEPLRPHVPSVQFSHGTSLKYSSLILKSALFWGITRRRVVIIYRRFGTTYRSHLHGSTVQVGKKAYNVDSGKYGGVAKRVM